MSKDFKQKVAEELFKKTRNYKYFAYCAIYQAEFEALNSVNKNCRELEISKMSYCRWKKKHGLFSSKQIKSGTFKCVLPPFKLKICSDALSYIQKYKEEFGIASGSNHIRKWIWKNFKVRISNKTIRFLKQQNPDLFPLLTQKKKKSGAKPNIRVDQIGKDYSTTEPHQKIGMDGTHFNPLYINGKQVNIVCEIAYDWFTKHIAAWAFSPTENVSAVTEVLTNLSVNYLKSKLCLIQMDRGGANTSNKIVELEKEKSNFVISMSEAGFKHNSPTEALNRWIKERFFKTYGYHFKSLQNFLKIFDKFVSQHNKFQTYLSSLQVVS